MAVFGPPPTPALREEWQSLSKETRREALSVLFGPRGLSDADVQARLVELGMSAELAEWACREAMDRIRSLARLFDSDAEPRRRGRIDRFNVLLGTLIFALLSLTWFAQEVRAFQDSRLTLGIIPAAIVSIVSCIIFLVSLRGWIRSLKRRP